MILRERGAAPFFRPAIRRDPLEDGIFIDGIGRTLKGGGSEDKVRAVLKLSSRIDEGDAPMRESGELLRVAIKDSDRSVRWSAAITLARHGSEFLPQLCEGLSNDDLRVRAMSAAMVRSIISRDVSAFSDKPGEKPLMALMLVTAACGRETAISDDAILALERIARASPMDVLGPVEDAAAHEPRLEPIRAAVVEALAESGRKNRC